MSAPSLSACPACVTAPLAENIAAARDEAEGHYVLSLPGIHCAACISSVEAVLRAQPQVTRARVNLTLKRAYVDSASALDIHSLTSSLTEAGFETYELDADSISATQTDRQSRALLTRIAVAGFAMMNVMLLSVAVWSGATDVTRDMFHWISASIALPAVAFSAQPFFTSAWSALSARRLNMDVPIALAIALAAGMSLFETMHSGAHAYFDAALSLTLFLLVGRFLDARTRSTARSAAEELTAMEVPRALRENGESCPVRDLLVGDVLRLLPGTRVPLDGVVLEGTSELDRSLMTGESLPAQIGVDEVVLAGEINLTGVLLMRVTAARADTTLHKMAELVALAETARNSYTSLADRAAKLYAPLVHILAALAFVAWLLATADLRLSLNIAVAVLIITCPCALGLAVPAVTTAASGRLYRQGMLIKSATALERLAQVDTVVFDKTGTLTEGAPILKNFDALSVQEQSIAMALASSSAHPLARALFEVAQQAGVTPAPLCDVKDIPGFGVEANWLEAGLEGAQTPQKVRLGRAAWLEAPMCDQTATFLKIGAQPAKSLLFEDHLRDGAAEAVAQFKAQGHEVILLSGDAQNAVHHVAKDVGIERWNSQCLPQEKAAFIENLTREGRHVLMIGDGLNDTAALAAAHVSISPATAIEATRVVSDIVLLGASLAPLASATQTSRKAILRIKENFSIATGYNLIAIPIALAGFATPLAAALAMSLSSISVSLNALRIGGK